ncbi:MAG: hypothetical protein C0403_01465 [Desulfobacterium sp.]|nr:hypothetical protein [Desulfobacterium sp.]
MKYFLCFIFLPIFVIANTAFCAQVGNISDPASLSQGSISGERPYALMAGIESDFVSDKRFNEQTNNFKFNFYGMKIGSIIRDRLYVYGIVGVGEIKDKKSIYDYDPNRDVADVRINYVDIQTGQNMVFGAGITAIMHEEKLDEDVFFRIGFDAKYRRISFDSNNVRVNLTDNATGAVQDYNASYAMNVNEFQGAIVASYQYEKIAPYIGYRISDWNGEEELVVNSFTAGNINYNGSLETNGQKGYCIGVTYYISKAFSIGLEGRERDERALNLTAQMRF